MARACVPRACVSRACVPPASVPRRCRPRACGPGARPAPSRPAGGRRVDAHVREAAVHDFAQLAVDPDGPVRAAAAQISIAIGVSDLPGGLLECRIGLEPHELALIELHLRGCREIVTVEQAVSNRARDIVDARLGLEGGAYLRP